MAKDPAVLFYTSDFLSGTITMTDEQVGRYIKLLCIQHQKGKLTAKDMLSICKAYDEDVYSKFVKDGEFFYNERMKNEAEKRKNFTESRKKNAQSTKNQSNKDKSICSAYAQHMENENENTNENINRIINEKPKLIFPYNSPDFLNLWSELVKGPKWKKKTITALQASLKILSRHPEPVAIKMIEDCLAGNWQGLVEPKNNFYAISGNGNAGSKQGTSDARIEALKNW